MAPRKKPSTLSPPPPQPTEAKTKEPGDPPYAFERMEALLNEVVDPYDGESITYDSLESTFRWIVFNARKRRLLDEPFGEALDKCTEIHASVAGLKAAIAYKRRLVAACSPMAPVETPVETPEVDKEINEYLNKIKATRVWAIRHLALVRQCPPEGTKLN